MKLWLAAIGLLAVVAAPGTAVAAPAAKVAWAGPTEYRPSMTATVALSVTVTTPAAPNGFSLRIYDATDGARCTGVQGIGRSPDYGTVWPVAAATTMTIHVPVIIACGMVAPTVEHFRADLVRNDALGRPTRTPVATADRVMRPVAAPAIRVDHPPAVKAGGSSVFAATYVNDTDVPVHAADLFPGLRFYDPSGSEGGSRLEWSADRAGPWQGARLSGDGAYFTLKSPIAYDLPRMDVPAHGTAAFWLRYTPGSGVHTGRVSISGGWDDPDKFVPIDGIDVTNPKPHAATNCLVDPNSCAAATAPLYWGGGILGAILLFWGIRRVMRATSAARARS